MTTFPPTEKGNKLRLRYLVLVVLIFLVYFSSTAHAQDTIKFSTIKSIRDIPHATAKQKWMWPHRSIIFFFMKEHVPQNDTSYYFAFKGKFVLTLPITSRFAHFRLGDANSSNYLQYVPNAKYDFGIGISTRFATFIVNSGVSLLNNDEATKGKTSYRDYQINFYGKKATTDLSFQRYRGFYILNSNSYDHFTSTHANRFEVRPDISTFTFSYNHYRIFNHKRFSYRGSFAFTELQKKNAGSILAGGYVSLFSLKADSSLVSASFSEYFDPISSIKAGSVFNGGINIGYVYSLVFLKKMHATVSFVQGLGTSKTSTTHEDNSITEGKFRFSSKQNLRIGVRYDNKKFFMGTMGTFDFYYFDDAKRSTLNYSYGKFRVFAGYRFQIARKERRLLRKLNLIDYRL